MSRRRTEDGQEEAHGRRDRREAAAGGRSDGTRSDGGGSHPADRRHRGHVLPLAERVRWAQIRPGQAAQGVGDGERPVAPSRLGPHPGEADPQGGRLGKLVSPARRRACVDHVIARYGVSERLACRVLGQHRSTQRKVLKESEDEAALTADIIALATQYGRYGYRRITALLRDAGWWVNKKRVERIWRREGLKVPQKQPKKGRLWLADGSCIRLRPEYHNHVWSYDFVEDRTHDGRKFRMLNIIDEFTRECLAIRVNRKLKAVDVIDVLSDLFILRGIPGYIRSDNVLCGEAATALSQQISARRF